MSSSNLFKKNYFELFALELDFSQDLEKLRKQYLTLQSQFHPDKVASASGYERQFILQVSTLINDAYQILKNPVTRAQYLLTLENQTPVNNMTYAFDEDFLMQQMALREQIAQLKESTDSEEIASFKKKVQLNISDYEIALSHAFQNKLSTEKINQLICELQFYQKLEKELKEI